MSIKQAYFPILLSICCLLLTAEANAQFVRAELHADGNSCCLCSNTLYQDLHSIKFIDSVDVDYGHSQFNLYFKPDSTIDFEEIRKKVDEAGFYIVGLITVYNFKNLPIDSISCFNFQGLVFCFLNTSSKTLDGEVPLKLVDAGFITDEEYKQYEHELFLHPYDPYIQVYHVVF